MRKKNTLTTKEVTEHFGASTREETRREECEKEACREEGDEEEGEVTDEAAKPEITTYFGSLRSQELKRIAFASSASRS
jgi:hypothetical protein